MPKFGSYTTIEGISDVRRLPRAGKIRLGVKKKAQSGSEYPAEVSYFVANEEDFASRANFEKFREVYGDRPDELDIFFPVEDMRVFFPQAFKKYGARGLVCKGNGVDFTRWHEDGTIEEGECPCPEECPFAYNAQNKRVECKRVGNLIFLLPRVTWAGTFQIDTSSFNSIVDINSAIDYIRPLAGRISMVPLKLRRAPKETQYEGKKATHYPMTLSFPDSAREIAGLLEDAKKMRSVFEIFNPSLQLEGPGPREIERDLFPKDTGRGAIAGLPEPRRSAADDEGPEPEDDEPPEDLRPADVEEEEQGDPPGLDKLQPADDEEDQVARRKRERQELVREKLAESGQSGPQRRPVTNGGAKKKGLF